MRWAAVIGMVLAGCTSGTGGEQPPATGTTTGDGTGMGPVDVGDCGAPDWETGCEDWFGNNTCTLAELRRPEILDSSCSLGPAQPRCFHLNGSVECAPGCLVGSRWAFVHAQSDDLLLWSDCTLRVPDGWVSCADPANPRPDICGCVCDEISDPPDTSGEPGCGNGIVEEGEVCDGPVLGGGQCHADCQGFDCSPQFADCNGEPDDGCEEALDSWRHCTACDNECDPRLCTPEGCALKVFVTSATHTGNLGGLDGADATCAAASFNTGNYRAWLHDGVEGPQERFTVTDRAYALDSGTMVAANFDQLMQQLDAPIDQDHSGGNPFNMPGKTCETGAWSNVEAGLLGGAEHCDGWTSEAPGPGRTGDWLATDLTWTSWCSADCSEPHSLFCFEQPE